MVLFEKKLAEHSAQKTTLRVMNMINHVLILFVTLYILYLAWPLTDPTSLHAFLCTLGSITLMSEGITALAGENVWSSRLKHRTSSHVHWVLQVLGAVCTVWGILAKLEPPGELAAAADGGLFGRLHVPLGGLSVLGVLLASLGGLPALYAAKLRKTVRPELSKLGHNCLGISSYLLGVGAQCVGYNSRWLRLRSAEMTHPLILVTGLVALLTLIAAFGQLRQQLRACSSRYSLSR